MSRIHEGRQARALRVIRTNKYHLILLGGAAMLVFSLPSGGARLESYANREISMDLSRTEKGAAVISYAELRTHRLPRATRKLLDRALKLDKRGSTSEALVLVEKALESAPDFVEAHTAAAIANLKLDRLGEAQLHLDQALEIDSTLHPAHEVQGILLFRRQRYAGARDVLEAVVQRAPGRAMAHQYLAGTLQELHEVDLARQHADIAERLRARPFRPRREPPYLMRDEEGAGWFR